VVVTDVNSGVVSTSNELYFPWHFQQLPVGPHSALTQVQSAVKAKFHYTDPTRLCRETRVYDPVSDRVRLGQLGFPTSLRTLSGRRLVRSISTCTDFVRASGQVTDKVRGSV